MKMDKAGAAGVIAALMLGVSMTANAVLATHNSALRNAAQMQRRRELTDIADAMSDIEINLHKLLVAAGAAQSVSLLSQTAMLAGHVEGGLSRLPLEAHEAADAMKFAGQMGQYALALCTHISGGGMLTARDERQIGEMLASCRALSDYIGDRGKALSSIVMDEAAPPSSQQMTITYPSLIYDGPFSDGRLSAGAKGLTGERVTRAKAREAAARAAGTTIDRVGDAADSGGVFEAFGFTADAPGGRVNVQITGQGAHVLWMMPERAEFAAKKAREDCLRAAQVWLGDMGFGAMQACFVQEYDGMLVANFAALQDGVLLYPDQVKVQVSMESGTVVGAECTQYLSHHCKREDVTPALSAQAARAMVGGKIDILSEHLCVIPQNGAERLCWEFRGTHQGAGYYVYIDAKTGRAADILRVVQTPWGEAAM